MTKEENIKSLNSFIDNQLKFSEFMIEAFRPPSEEKLQKLYEGLSDREVEGIYRYGSKQGKKLAKVECLKRGIIKKSILKRAKESINKLTKK